MMKNKRLLALLLALVLTLSALPTAWAAETADPTATDPAVETSEPPQVTEETMKPTEEMTPPTEKPTEHAAEPTAEPSNGYSDDYMQKAETIIETMDTFVEVVEDMPDADAVAAFNAAVEAYAVAHTYITKDMPLLTEDVDAYESAYRAFAEAMGYDPTSVEIEYPNSTLEQDLKTAVMEAMYLFYDAEDMYESLPQAQTQVMTLTEEEENQTISVADIDENYAVAKAKLDAILEAKPDLLENDVALLATDLGNGVKTVDAVRENIQMSLFNYGPQINTQVSGYALFPFVHSEGVYGWAVDSTGTKPADSAGGWPMLQTILTTARPYPYITEDKGTIKAGSLERIFNPNYSGSDRISIDAYRTNISSSSTSTTNPYQYGSVYFPVTNNDGSGTGLFQKEGNYFVYDSGKNAAWYNPDTQKFELYNYVVRPAYTAFSTSGTNGNFLPFNQGHTQGREDYQSETYSKEYTYTDSSGTSITKSTTVAKEATVTTKPSGALTAYRLNGTDRYSEVDLWFGMNLEFDFYQTESGLVGSEAMVFEFLGDDDVWIYIDDVLILDIGGTHGAQTGTINFATGAVTNPSSYGQYGTSGKASSTLYDLMKAALGDSLDETEFVDSNNDGKKDTFADFSKHNLKFYYLERGGNISYCKLKFNMDPLPTGNVTLQKNVAGINEALADDQTYQFKIHAKHTTESVQTIEYKVSGASGTSDTKTVANDGIIELKANEMATFTNLPVNTQVTFTEQSNNKTSETVWKLNGAVVEAATATVGADETDKLEFVCTNTRVTADLTVEKVFSGVPYEPNRTYDLTVTIAEKAYTGNATKGGDTVQITNGKISLAVGESITIKDIPTGMSYSVVESDPTGTSGYQYADPVYTGAEDGDINAVGMQSSVTVDTTVKVTNSHVLADLVIDKDTDLETITAIGGKEDMQSFLFRVEGGPADIDMNVIVKNDGSTIIQNLPVGVGEDAKYKVTELTNWSWRYLFQNVLAETDANEVIDRNNKSVTFDLTATGETTKFTNTWSQKCWLSDETHYRNLFNGVKPDPTPATTPTT